VFALPEPLHPALVHVPLGLAFLLPALALAVALAIALGWLPPRTWALVALAAAVLAASAWYAAEIGEEEGERVEKVVAEEPLHEHEEAGEWLVRLAALGFVAAAAGLLGGRPGATSRWAAVLISAAILAAAVRAGHLGGALVYDHGAAEAWRERPASD
jgi:uncharacterized membrane protein